MPRFGLLSRTLAGLVLLKLASSQTEITFLHWNDQHARVEPADDSGGTCATLVSNNDTSTCFGGYAKLATFFNQVSQASSERPLLTSLSAAAQHRLL